MNRPQRPPGRRLFADWRQTAARWALLPFELVVVVGVRLLRLVPIGVLTTAFGRAGQMIGPLHPRTRVGLDNLRHAFPEKSEAERRAIIRAMWGHLFRLGAEYLQIDRVFDRNIVDHSTGQITAKGIEVFERLRDDGKAGLIFTGHLGNWELLQISAVRFGLDTSSLYRPPNIGLVAGLVDRARARAMHSLVESRPGAAYDLMSTLDRGGHVGLLVDQKFGRRSRVMVDFFGRPATANPLLAQLARRYDCPVHGARAIRQPDGGHRLEITEEIALPRDADGAIDVEEATKCMARIVEGWVREYPEQWLWIHRRWKL